MEEIILVGFGGHARSVIDSIESGNQYHILGYTDFCTAKEDGKYKYLGNDEVLREYYERGIRYAFISLGYMGKGNLREKIYEQLRKIGYKFPAIVDKTAVLANDVRVGEGAFIGKKCVVNANSSIGKMCIINTGAVIEHDNWIGDFSHISVNSTLCGMVSIGNHSFIGANSTVIQEVSIGEKSIVGAGAVVTDDLPKGCTAVGIPAKVIGGQT